MKPKPSRTIAIVGGGPAGLRAAEVASKRGADVTIFDAKASVGRKFLVAGKSGLNLTNSANFESFAGCYDGTEMPHELWQALLGEFDNDAMRKWALDLEISTFTASSGKVFPTMKKAAPLLRRWILKLRSKGVKFAMKHRFIDFKEIANKQIEIEFQEEGGSIVMRSFDSVILALGGASWPQTGSDGRWAESFKKKDISVISMQSDNCGWLCDWSPKMLAQAEGMPLHNLQVSAEGEIVSGELLITKYGFEGTPIYTLGRRLRRMKNPVIEIDFKPTFTVERLIQKMESARKNFYHEAALRWKLAPGAEAIIRQIYGEISSAQQLAEIVKCCKIRLKGTRPIEEAISTAGGVAWSELDENLMLKKFPQVFCAGEMIDWEAPTGGFLMQGCFITGTRAGEAAATI